MRQFPFEPVYAGDRVAPGSEAVEHDGALRFQLKRLQIVIFDDERVGDFLAKSLPFAQSFEDDGVPKMSFGGAIVVLVVVFTGGGGGALGGIAFGGGDNDGGDGAISESEGLEKRIPR